MLAKTSENLDYDELCRPPAAGQEQSTSPDCFAVGSQLPRDARTENDLKAVMVPRQTFWFSAQSETLVEDCLRSLDSVADLDEERETFLFTSKAGDPAFRCKCVIVQGGIEVDRSGNYFGFLGHFVDALASEFGKIASEADSRNG